LRVMVGWRQVSEDGPRVPERNLTAGWIEGFERYRRDTQEEVRRDRVLAGLVLGLRRLDLSSFMREVARHTREVLGVEFCEVLELLVDKDRMLLRVDAGWEEGLDGRKAGDIAFESRTGPTLFSRNPIVIEDSRHEAHFEWVAPCAAAISLAASAP
jgi:hypothetical protein